MITKEEKIQFLKMALALQGICINERTSDQLVTTYEAIVKKGKNFRISDAVDIELGIVCKYEIKQKEVSTTKNESDE